MAKDIIYSYPTMEKKLQELAATYPAEYFRYESLGTTYGKRHIYACYLGPQTASRQFVLTASIHGREYINTTVLLEMLEHYLANYTPLYQKEWGDLCVCVIPMANPDGVAISMTTDAKRWKENGLGVDLNRNFPCGFGEASDRNRQNPGEHAGDQLETQHLMNFIEGLSHPLAVIHYHSRGNLIYYDYKVGGVLKAKICHLANIVHAVTGYRLVENTKDTRPAGGFGDWCVYEKKIPSITIETGFLKTPVPKWQRNGICYKNLFVLRDLLSSIL